MGSYREGEVFRRQRLCAAVQSLAIDSSSQSSVERCDGSYERYLNSDKAESVNGPNACRAMAHPPVPSKKPVAGRFFVPALLARSPSLTRQVPVD